MSPLRPAGIGQGASLSRVYRKLGIRSSPRTSSCPAPRSCSRP